MATDLAEFIGAALGFHLLFGMPLFPAALITGVASFGILALQARGFRNLEAVIAGLVGVIVAGFAFEVFAAKPSASGAASGLIPGFDGSESVLLAAGILGATVMPHVIYLHSALTQRRVVGENPREKQRILRFERIDVIIAMVIAGAINLSMLLIGAAVFHASGLTDISSLDEVYKGLGHAARAAHRRRLRHRAARVGALVVVHRHDGRSGRHAGLHPPPDPAVSAPHDHDGAGADRHRGRRERDVRPGAQPGRALVRDPLRADPARPLHA